MTIVRRFDASPLRASKTPAGFLRGDARVTRVGVFTYRNADGSTRRELRHPDEVFKAASLASLALAPITLGHPTEAVTSSNARKYAIGAVGDQVRSDGRFVTAPFAIHDDAAIGSIESGRTRELSCGYNCDLDWTPGAFEGEQYDAVQRDIVYNHLAVLAQGRAGSEVRIDGTDAVRVDLDDARHDAGNTIRHDAHDTREGTNMKIKINGVDYEVADQVAQAFNAHSDALTAKLAIEAKRADEAQAKIDAATARADAADAKVKTLQEENAPAKVQAKIKARVDLVTRAQTVLGAATNLDEKTDDEIKRAVIVKVTPSAKLDDKSADYIAARFDHAMEAFDADHVDDAPAAVASKGAVREALARADASAADDDAASAYKKMIERNRNAWKPKATA